MVSLFIIHQIFLLTRDWSKHVTWPNIPPKTGEYPRIFPNFKTGSVAKKYLKDNKHNSLHFDFENMLLYLSLDIKLSVFLELRSGKAVRLSEQVMSADKYPSIFSCQMEAIVYVEQAQGFLIYGNLFLCT